MKRLFILLSALSVIGCASTGSEEKAVTEVCPNQFFNDGDVFTWETFNGRVHRITQTQSAAEDRFVDIIKTETYRTCIYSYNIDGQLTELIKHRFDGSIKNKRVLDYNDAGKKQTAYI